MILNIYKEKDWTSFDVVAKIRGMLRTARNSKRVKVGHAGTLDPLAEGVLIVLTDNDTKKQDDLMKSDKEYECEIEFGIMSETYDLEGPITQVPLPEGFKLRDQLPEVLKKYIGEIEQTVPPFSAVKVKGKPLYKQARKGKVEASELPTKKVNIYEIEILEVNDNKARLRVVCSKGTYIRSLAHDLGKDLNTGALLTLLVRTRVGDFHVDDSQKVSELKV